MNYDYEIIEEIGRGSYGIIYKIKKHNHIYAMKEINTTNMSIKQSSDALKEVNIMSSLSHPNIIQFVTSHIVNKKIRIIMEFADNDLSRYVSKSQQHVSETIIWAFIMQILQGLQYLHKQNVIHRDIKPNNILLKDNQVKLGDLGVSKILGDLTLAKSRVGTPLYLAPELIKNKPYDNKVDIWAAGCVIYYMCQKHPPFQGNNLISLGYNIVNRNPKPIDSRYSKKLQTVLMKMMHKLPSVRLSAQECIEYINGYEMPHIPQSLTRVGNSQSHHSQGDISKTRIYESMHSSQDQIQSSYYQQILHNRLNRIIQHQKESEVRVSQSNQIKQLRHIKLIKHTSEHFEPYQL